MNNKIYTTGEILTIQSNLREIEKNLGYPVPGRYIDYAEMKDHIFSPGEVVTVCSNIRHVSKSNNYRRYPTYSAGLGGSLTPILILVVLGVIFKLIGLLFGISIL